MVVVVFFGFKTVHVRQPACLNGHYLIKIWAGYSLSLDVGQANTSQLTERKDWHFRQNSDENNRKWRLVGETSSFLFLPQLWSMDSMSTVLSVWHLARIVQLIIFTLSSVWFGGDEFEKHPKTTVGSMVEDCASVLCQFEPTVNQNCGHRVRHPNAAHLYVTAETVD